MKKWLLFLFYLGLALRAGAYVLPVIDSANLEQQVQNEYQNLTQYIGLTPKKRTVEKCSSARVERAEGNEEESI
jgi:hypothetical protein